jgi:hypothetical protein
MSFKKVEEEKDDKITNKDQAVYTYEVSMVVSVFAENQEAARKTLDESGGFVSYRNVKLKDSVSIYKPE